MGLIGRGTNVGSPRTPCAGRGDERTAIELRGNELARRTGHTCRGDGYPFVFGGGGSLMMAQNMPRLRMALTNWLKSTGLTTKALTPRS